MQLFADSQTHFAAVSEDGRLKLWDVAAGALQQELKERDHLSYRYTCLAWSQPASSSKSKKRSGASDLGLLALGASNGSVVVWDLATGEVKHTLQNETNHAVQALAFNPQGSLLYASSADKHVLEWSVSSGQTERKFRVGSGGASALAVSSDGEVLAAGGSALRTFDLSSGKKSRKLVSGLSSAVTQLRFAAIEGELEASRFLFAATAGARFVNMYDLQLTEHDAPALTFSLPSSVDALFARATAGEAVAAKKSKKNKKKGKKEDAEDAKQVVDLLVGATAPAGAMFVWSHKYEQVSDVAELALASKPLPPTLATEESAGVLLAEISTQDDNKAELLVARGSLVKPVFEKVSLVEENAPSQWKKELEFAEISDALLLKAERDEAALANGNKRQKVETTAEDEKTHVPTLSERAALANSMAVVDDTTSFEELNGEANEEEDDVTLAERVEALRERVEGDVTAALSRAERDAEAPEDKERGNKPDASSLASVLEQALQARDNALLEYCLRTRDAKVVARTVARVPAFRVLALLEVIVRKLERSPNRFARLCPWLRAVLLHHTAYLVAQPDLVPNLSALYQLLETRLQVHEQMQKLAGRLTLVLGQIHVNTASTELEDDEVRAAVVYHEGEEEVRDEAAKESSNEEDESEEEDEDEGVETEDE
jgi:U3 small nucleolar RNA-associated protein 5